MIICTRTHLISIDKITFMSGKSNKINLNGQVNYSLTRILDPEKHIR